MDALNPTLAPGLTLGGTFCADDGYITPPRNVTAYAVALAVSGVEVRERGPFTGLVRERRPGHRRADQRGPDRGRLVVLTGGPELAEVGRPGRAADPGRRGPAPGRGDRAASRIWTRPGVPMVFDLAAGLYWRPEEGGLLFGMSNPDEPPGAAARSRRGVPRADARAAAPSWCRSPLGSACAGSGRPPSTTPRTICRSSAPRSGPDGPLAGVTVASAGGAGMMWGPGVARAAADIALTGCSDVVDTAPLGLGRFDAAGRSRLAADPIALPFPRAGARTWRRASGRPDASLTISTERTPTMTDTNPATPFLAAAALAGELEDWGPLAEATGDADADVRRTTLWPTATWRSGSGSARRARPTGSWRPTRPCTSCPAG